MKASILMKTYNLQYNTLLKTENKKLLSLYVYNLSIEEKNEKGEIIYKTYYRKIEVGKLQSIIEYANKNKNISISYDDYSKIASFIPPDKGQLEDKKYKINLLDNKWKNANYKIIVVKGLSFA